MRRPQDLACYGVERDDDDTDDGAAVVDGSCWWCGRTFWKAAGDPERCCSNECDLNWCMSQTVQAVTQSQEEPVSDDHYSEVLERKVEELQRELAVLRADLTRAVSDRAKLVAVLRSLAEWPANGVLSGTMARQALAEVEGQ